MLPLRVSSHCVVLSNGSPVPRSTKRWVDTLDWCGAHGVIVGVIFCAIFLGAPAARGVAGMIVEDNPCHVWSPRNFISIGGHAMAYDSVRGVVVMQGGVRNNIYYSGETWIWDGDRWRLAFAGDDRSPGKRVGHSMAFDRARGVMVLFGGNDGHGDRGETWEWDGYRWTRRDVSGPSPRSEHAMVYDELRGEVVLFGGRVNGVLNNETWTWDGTSWTLRSTEGPAKRSGHAMSFDRRRGVVVLYGGSGRRDTWEWDGVSWTQRGSTGPGDGSVQKMVYDSDREVSLLYCRTSRMGEYNSDIWQWDGESWGLLNIGGPDPRTNTAMAYDEAHGVAVLFGGQYNILVEDFTWLWDGRSWSARSTGLRPRPRYGHTMAYDSRRGVTVLVGKNDYLPDSKTWEWDGVHWTMRDSGTLPVNRQHAMAYDGDRGVLVLYGGTSDRGSIVGTWEYDGTTWTERVGLTPNPGRKYSHAMAYDEWRKQVVLFGEQQGDNLPAHIAETWLYDGTQWRQYAGDQPTGRMEHAMAFDARRGVVVLFGGRERSFLGDTWEWDGAGWTLRATSGPSPRYKHAMTYDPKLGAVVLHGGMNRVGEYLDDIWAWNGGKWERIGTGPFPTCDHAMAFDTRRGALVMQYGELDGRSVDARTWEWTVDEDCNGLFDGDNPCAAVERFSAKSKARGRAGSIVRASARISLAAGTVVTFTLNGTEPRQRLVPEDDAPIRVRWMTDHAGPHTVCILQCHHGPRCIDVEEP